MKNTNSPAAAGLTAAGLVLAFVWESWSGLAIFVVAFLLGALGTLRNVQRSRRW